MYCELGKREQVCFAMKKQGLIFSINKEHSLEPSSTILGRYHIVKRESCVNLGVFADQKMI